MVGLFMLGACALSMPGPVFTNGVVEDTPGTKAIKAQVSSEFFSLFGLGLGDTAGVSDRNELREKLMAQCSGGRLEALSANSSMENYVFFIRSTVYEHATCVMPHKP